MTANGNQILRIKATGVEGVQISGQPWTKNRFKHENVTAHGGTIELELGEMEAWETGSVPPPPGHIPV
ncbi:uncharacterized protein ACLA_037200 [Aspergillus clavatus NRRL 1]|uniref:Uncharacterized protein n=1 Tax=Aspergillus clavatus (strain ATCC 1007 / CBS 513.65 / DSM 816 / NCTC 3887 / NRRL 1 / QM 1276 / 107) TaxID=344612 RepID=A1CK39_ASPCL|nr:uncharacterized protein ACLA_037200 [Aspergillus clavatus NRRL 1]EAW09513.1 hypothetical protein ACLA_037200 [Aspergillus clavatus NRRL 1]